MEQVQNTNVSNEAVEGGATEVNKVQEVEVKQEKTFTQEEVNAILEKRIAREVKKIEAEKQKAMELELKAELEEAEKLAKMSEAERVKAKAEKEKAKFDRERKKFEEEMRAFNRERMLNTTMTTLSEKNLPVEFASFLKADDADSIMENISVFEKHFNEALEKMVTERLKGQTPKVSTSSKSSYTVDQLRNMSAEEINKNWELIKKQMR